MVGKMGEIKENELRAECTTKCGRLKKSQFIYFAHNMAHSTGSQCAYTSTCTLKNSYAWHKELENTLYVHFYGQTRN